MNILIVTPAAPRSRTGNRVTAIRWQKILTNLGHRVVLSEEYEEQTADLLIALHAKRSSDSIIGFRKARTNAPLVLALTGTDLYPDLQRSRNAQKSLDLADRIVVLQNDALHRLQARWRKKARVIHQSVAPIERWRARSQTFDVCVVGHLRRVKDPFRAAFASRQLPADSKIRILHFGAALSDDMERRAREEMQRNKRYRWLGDVPQSRVRRALSQCRLFVISSRVEGGANALGEAIAAGLPVLASRIGGSVGILGEGYPGYFEVGDTGSLTELLLRCETDQSFLSTLTKHCNKLIPLFEPRAEEEKWRLLLNELATKSS